MTSIAENPSCCGRARVLIVLIDKDIPGVTEAKPSNLLTADDITLTEDEVDAHYGVVLQDPPDDSDYDHNNVDSLNLWVYRRQLLQLKYYVVESPTNSGTAHSDGGAANKLELDLGSEPSTIDGFYVGDIITTTGGAGIGQSKEITAYDAASKKITVADNWSPSINSSTLYQITSTRNLKLATMVIDDASHSPHPRKIVRYATTNVWWDERALTLGKYDQSDYPDYDENAPWPPPAVADWNTFAKKPIRAIFVNGVFVEKLCEQLPPPPLPESES